MAGFGNSCFCLHLDILIFFLTALCFAQVIKFEKQQCFSKCTHGLINYQDKCQISVTVHLEESVSDEIFIYFENLKITENLFSIEIPSECKGHKPDANSYCTRLNSTTFNVTAILIAEPSYSNVQFRYYIITSKGVRVESKTFTFSATKDATSGTIRLMINGVNITNIESCEMVIPNHDLNLELNCSSDVIPCWMTLQLNDSVVLNETGPSATYKKEIETEEKLSIIISYAYCSAGGHVRKIACKIKQGTPDQLKQSANNASTTQHIVISISVILAFITIAFCVFLYFRLCGKKQRSGNRHGNKIETTAEQINETQSANNDTLKYKDEIQDLLENEAQEMADEQMNETSLVNNESLENSDGNSMETQGLLANEEDFTERKKRINTSRENISDEDNIISAIKKKNIELAINMIERGIDVNNKTDKNETAIMFACEQKNKLLCSLLINKGAHLDEQNNKSKKTALMIACNLENVEIVQLLIESGANLEFKDMAENTALMIACKQGFYSIARMLIENNADINTTDKAGSTPLMAASAKNHQDIVTLLNNKMASCKS